jgi:L-iditol 2-dehydrogenase
MNETMRAVLFYGPKEIRLERVPIPKPGPGEVLLRVGAALTCGTDFKAYRQGHPVLLGQLPSPFGHELAGTVVSVGEGVRLFSKGDRVVAANSAPCDDCFYCKRGQNQLCDNLKLHNGAYAEYNLVPARIVKHNLYSLPDSLDFQHAALSEPLACAIHAVDVLGIGRGDSVAVIGAGTMSLLLIGSLAARGARILVIGRDPRALEKSLAAGAHEVFSIKDGDPVPALKRATEGRGPDCVIEAVGTAETWQQSIAMVRKGGKVCVFGGCAYGTQVPMDAHRIHYSQISVHGVFHHTPKYFAAALDLLSRGKVRTDLLITERIPLDEVPSFFDLRHGKSNPKAAVIP